MDARPTLAIFPYLKTSQPVRLRGIEFRSSDDVDGLSGEVRAHLDSLFRMFYLQGDMRIERMSYASLAPAPDENEARHQLRVLNEVQEAICYLYSAPHPTSGDPFLRQEHSSLFCFSPASVSWSLVFPEHNTVYVGPAGSRPEPDDRGEVEGYEVRINGVLQSWVVHGSRIYPPAARLWLNISQDLSLLCAHAQDSSHSPLVELLRVRAEREDISEAVLTALSWYNRSLSISVADEVAVVHLAIAFESLLGLEQGESITARFKEGVSTLVGRFPRLDSWLQQFYRARSEIVDQGRSTSLMFDVSGRGGTPGSPYRSMLSFGRRLFQLCLSARLFGVRSLSRAGLSSWLTTNQERFERVCKYLSEEGRRPADRMDSIEDDVLDIESFRSVPEANLSIPTMLSAAKALAKTYLQTDPAETPEVLAQMKRLAGSGVRTESEHLEALDALCNINEALPKTRISGQGPHMPRHLFAALATSVWHYCFLYYFHLVRKRGGENRPAAPEGG